MLNVATKIWNDLAAQGNLKTEKYRRLMALPNQELIEAHEREAEELEHQGADPAVALAYLQVAPLLAERGAIATFLQTHPGLAEALPRVETVEQAVAMMSRSRHLTPAQQRQLSGLLSALNSSTRSAPTN